jgi:hypothetical protein
MNKIVFGPEAGVATVPIRFNGTHPNRNYANKSYLPCVIFKKTMGTQSLEHTTYLLTVFLDITDNAELTRNPNLIGTASPGVKRDQAAPAVDGDGPTSGSNHDAVAGLSGVT